MDVTVGPTRGVTVGHAHITHATYAFLLAECAVLRPHRVEDADSCFLRGLSLQDELPGRFSIALEKLKTN